ncbi:hypothetical protein LTR02_006202 [Friedmanniomyces endolithicus]|uniref:C2H2-type domain-containing protein n=1 Tax=Rachicladosporium monterosium TaxID=1507873 RepID=A0ABR0LH46_9PEZI|nr:hypothetical protein LTR94_014666 [Friedmanniomyces endolithicus]KAK5148671.1 hypothetical protein LTR32_000029 [Rachicladosporium monterosium]KAK0783959.1 hypothetical protein LTR38_012820 [Friedmanniomyces endolithicus]KAK0789272.1 hypothetical protein LTR59_009701 [Friedmanniomyces endolithicus]KAK0825572.1 hypothetical protein LTR03_017425 [Friedmanniomyces endolithicus]
MYECDTCTRCFVTEHQVDQHMDSKDHWAYDFKCETCDDQYRTRAAVDEHMAKNGHWKNYCSDCDRHFQSESNYRAHRNSRLHLGRSIPCPFCRAAHTTASGLLHHLETASCPHARTLNRDRILQIVRERDPHHLITNKQIGWHAEDSPSTTYSATDAAWNGYEWECYLCHRGFGTVRALDQHLNSSVHRQKTYHCPKAGCGREFAALAALFGHWESESCGFMRFEKVQGRVGDVLSGGRLIGFG